MLPPSRYGWAFLLAWVFCLFYSCLMDGFRSSVQAGQTPFALDMLVQCAPVCSAIAALVLVVAFEGRLKARLHSASAQLLAALCASAATPLFFVQLPSTGPSLAVTLLASAVTGAGSGLMWLMWTELYARMPQDEVEHCAQASAVLAACISFVAMIPSGWFSVLLVSLFPLLAGIACVRTGRQLSNAAQPQPAVPPQGTVGISKGLGRVGLGVFAASFFASVLESFWEPGSSYAFEEPLLLFLFSIVFMLIVSVTATAMPRRVTLPFMFRWTCPLIALGYALIIVFGAPLGTFLATMIAFAVRFTFCLITQMYFALCAARGLASTIRSCGMGWICIHSGDLLGIIATNCFLRGIDTGTLTLNTLSALLLPLLVAVFMFVLGSDGGFLGSPFASTPARVPAAEDVLPASHEPAAPQQPATTQAAEPQALPPNPQGDPAPDANDLFEQRIATLAAEHGLTPRETEVFELLARGRSVPYIRDTLIISRNTAATHTKRIYTKLDVHSRQELIDLVSEE